ncbi:MAG TPA: DUF6134 family protein [Alphaproteobacteria bacterium]|nr:DUF6134 family protein [Alphaproteobacteria bacterium]
MIRMLATAATTVVLAATALASTAQAEVPPGSYLYEVVHSRYGKIGTHRITLVKERAQTIVTTALRLRVKILFVTAHRESAERREIWQGGRLVLYSSTTVENGKTIKVEANAAGGKLAINGPKGATTAPGGTFITNPWNVAILKAKMVMDSKTGAVKPVTAVAPQGEETVSAGGAQVKATKYLFRADTRRFLWYDAAGRLVKFQVFNDGNTVTFTLK